MSYYSKFTSANNQKNRKSNSSLGYYPSRSQEDDDTEYVDHNRGEDTIPHAKKDWL